MIVAGTDAPMTNKEKINMEAKIECNIYRCENECTEHAYCDSHYEDALKEQFDAGKKEGYEEARQEFNQ